MTAAASNGEDHAHPTTDGRRHEHLGALWPAGVIRPRQPAAHYLFPPFLSILTLTFNGREAKLLCNLGVLDVTSLVQSHALNALGNVAAGGNGGSAAESLELDVADDAVLADTDLELHDAEC